MDILENMSKQELKDRITDNVKTLSRKKIQSASPTEIYEALAFTIRDVVTDKWIATHEAYDEQNPKTVYYLSMEFLMGRFLGNTIINLCMSPQVKEVLEELGVDYNLIEDAERDPGLGNGGLGRLAACFLDSLSTLEMPAYGCGIRYHYGIFSQKIENGEQVEYSDNWLEDGDIWGVKRPEYAVEVKFGGTVAPMKQIDGSLRYYHQNYQSVMAIPYDYPVIGFNTNTVNTLRLWDANPKNQFDLASFNQGNYSKAVEEENLARTLSEVLYPADDHVSGKELRLKQQYFFISATLQRVLTRFREKHKDFKKLPEKVVFQLNDTHPSMAVAELMRILLDEYGLDWDAAWDITRRTCAYTNHTIMSEALEKWPVEIFSRLLPRIYMITDEINRRFCIALKERYGNDAEKLRKMAIIADGQVRMAHLAIVGSFSVNGVAALHTEILKNQELKDFYDIYPEKFNNKTNGITQRRWLALCNPGLASLISNTIGQGWLKNLDELQKLKPLADDRAFQEKFMGVKRENKVKMSNLIRSTMGVSVDPDSIFDIQVKRLHEYKRQLLNILNVMDLYNQLRLNPNLDVTPRTFIFGAKAAASYRRAKLIIKLINSVGDVVNNDKALGGKLKVLFMENYRVSLAEKLIPSADLSEQISTASKEASGTGNMKFMLNGALTIGTLDGANVEILEEVGKDNIFIFGLTSDQVIKLYQTNEYQPWDVCNMNSNVNMVMTQLINGTFSPGKPDQFRELYDALLNGYGGSRADEYFILKDFESYSDAQARVNKAFKDKKCWAKSAILNTASSGKFSSDRTIKEYSGEIWKLNPVHIG
ncbi:MAG: glycogen/starch/alpha-glucan phosphorylase [Clostridiales bacterium]|jgi:starch phosphorylase|nr:glycogen/starch/alpha-glucan phosphorylase [Clostridiales bacterium]